MSYLQLLLVRKGKDGNISTKSLNEALLQIQHAVNNINTQNFPNKINGDAILNADSVPLSILAQQRFDIPLLAPAAAASTTSTTGANMGGLWRFNPADYSGGMWYLAGTIATQNAAATATLEIWGASALGSISTISTSGVWVKSTALTMPTGETDLVLKLKTSDATYAAYVYNAFLLYVP